MFQMSVCGRDLLAEPNGNDTFGLSPGAATVKAMAAIDATSREVNMTPDITTQIQIIDDDSLESLAAVLRRDIWLPACDTETVFRPELEVDGIPGAVRVISIAAHLPDGSEQAFVIDLRDTDAAKVNAVLSEFTFSGWNAGFDERALAGSGIETAGWYDLMIADTLTRSGRTGVQWYRSLAAVTELALGFSLDGKGSVQTSYDATSDLSEEQIRYAGYDAIVTRRVANWCQANVEAAGLTEAVELEQGARPFIAAMQKYGVPFDIDGYLDAEIAQRREQLALVLEDLANMTEGRPLADAPNTGMFAQVKLADEGDCDDRLVVAWNPGSKSELIDVLNTHAREAVEAAVAARTGKPGLLTDADPLRKDDLKAIEHPIAQKVLEARALAKVVQTYGADLSRFVVDGRLRCRYKQGGLVSTGRLASEKPNLQNLSPAMLGWMRPDEGRVLVYADLGQAELRVAAHLSQEDGMLEAFRAGTDFHNATIEIMYPGVDLKQLAAEDPKTLKRYRTSAKSVGFGVPYGMGAQLLAKNLSAAGVETSKEEAAQMLESYYEGRPKLAAWLFGRDDYVVDQSKTLPELDFRRSFKLLALRKETEGKKRALKKKLGRIPTHVEVAQAVWPDGPRGAEPMSDTELEVFWQEQGAALDWAYSFEGAVLLTATGAPFEFESRTVSGRRRVFDVPMDVQADSFKGMLNTVVLAMASSSKPAGRAFVAEFAEANDLRLPSASQWRSDRSGSRVAVTKAFKDAGAGVKLDFVRAAVKHFGWVALEPVLRRAAADCVRAARTPFRNHPVQGSVADIMEHGFGLLMKSLPEGAHPVLSVHDSVTIECDERDAPHVAQLVHDSLMAGMARYAGSCVAVVDTDVRSSLADSDVLWEYKPEAN